MKSKHQYPKVDLIINKRQDKGVAKCFHYSRDLLGEMLGFVDSDQFTGRQEEIVNAFIDHFYDTNDDKMAEELAIAKKEWARIEAYFFAQCDRMFSAWPWPEKKHTGTMSIWWRFPRYISRRTFNFPFVRRGMAHPSNTNSIIAHEMLHFLEYDYMQKKHGLKPSEMHSKNNSFWQFTENLNILIQKSDAWEPIMKGRGCKPYDVCIDQYNQMAKIWEKDQNIDNLIQNILM